MRRRKIQLRAHSLNSTTLTVAARAAQTPEMISVLLQQGYKALAVVFDVWGVANMVDAGMKEARGIVDAAAAAENGDATKADGLKANGAAQ